MIKTININEIPAINKGYVMQDIEDFLNSGVEACEVFACDGLSIQSLHSSYASAVKKNGYPIKVMRRKNRVFLVKKPADKED